MRMAPRRRPELMTRWLTRHQDHALSGERSLAESLGGPTKIQSWDPRFVTPPLQN